MYISSVIYRKKLYYTQSGPRNIKMENFKFINNQTTQQKNKKFIIELFIK